MNLFFDEEEAIKELQNRGYRVIKEDYPEYGGINTVKELANFFYSRRRYYNPDRKFPHSIDYSEDTKFISSFLKSRQKLGLDRKTAIAEAVLLIDALFRYEKQLGLKEPAISPRILAVRPIMDRICSFRNGEVLEIDEYDTHLYIDEINEYYNKYFSGMDFQRATEERNKILESLDDDHKERK